MFPRSFHSLISCILLSCLTLCGYGEALLPLSDAQADAMILSKEQSKAGRKAARIAELEQATVMSEGRGVLPNGQKVIVREVEPPANVAISEVKVSAPQTITLTAEQVALFEAYAEREHHTLMLSATVYDHRVTRLRWTHEGVDYLAYANLDFNYLRGVGELDTETASFLVLLGVGDLATDSLNPDHSEALPPLPAFSTEHSEYVLMQGDASNNQALAGVEALLAHYDANEALLKVEHQRREALTAAQQRYNAAHPKQPEDFIMQFWVPEPRGRKAGGE